MAPNAFDAFCRHAFGFLEQQGVRYLVIGGLAVVVVGEPRTTADADVIVFVSEEEAITLILEAAAAGFELSKDVERERLSRTGTMRFRQGPFQLDLITASLPFEERARARASRHELFGLPLLFPSPEDLILFKILAGRDKDLLDATGIARRHRGRLDVPYLETSLRAICDAAEDASFWSRLQGVLAKASAGGAE